MFATAALVAASIVVSPVGADSHTFDRAYHQARASAIVHVLPGVYPAQTLTPGGRRVVFVPGGPVTVGGVDLAGANNVEFRDMTIRGWTIESGNHVTFRRVTTLGAFYIDAPASWISIIGGSVGPSHNYDSYVAVPNDQVSQPSRHLLIDGVRFHDVTRDPGKHVECLMLADGVDVVIRNSTFTNCSVFDLFVTWWYFRPKVGPPTQVRIEHNTFERTSDGYYSMFWADYVNTASLPWSDFAITSNTCGQSANFGEGTRHQRFVVRRNRGC